MYGVLVVSRDSNFISQASRFIPNINKKIKVETLNDPSKIREALRSTSPIDVVVCDHDPPNIDAFSIFNEMNRIADMRPFIITTLQVDGEVAIKAFDQKMDYYLSREKTMNYLMDLCPKIVLCAEKRISEENRTISEKRIAALMSLLLMRERDFIEILNFALEESVTLTNSAIGYIAMYDEDTNKLKMAAWSKGGLKECNIENRPTTYDFDITGVWGDPIRQSKPIIINDYQNMADNLKIGTPPGHIQLNRLLMIPIYHKGKILATAGLGNKVTKYNSEDLMQFTLFMDGLISIYHERILEEESKKSEQNLKSILQNAPVGIIIVDSDMSITASNDYAMSLISYNSLDLSKESLKSNPDDLSRIILKDVENVRNSNKRFEFEHNIEKNGVNIVLKVNISKIKGDNGDNPSFIIIIDDISELVTVNRQQIIAMERINLLDNLINDDINGHLIKMKEKLHDGNKDYLEEIEKDIEFLDEIMAFVKEYHEVGVLEPCWQDLDEILRKAVEINGFDEDSVKYNVKGVRVLADPSFVNVFSQLMQYSNAHSNGIMKCSIKCRIDAGDIMITYSDNGEGIPYEEKNKFALGTDMDHGRGIYLAVNILKVCRFNMIESGIPGKGMVVDIIVPAPKYSISWE